MLQIVTAASEVKDEVKEEAEADPIEQVHADWSVGYLGTSSNV